MRLGEANVSTVAGARRAILPVIRGTRRPGGGGDKFLREPGSRESMPSQVRAMWKMKPSRRLLAVDEQVEARSPPARAT